MNSEHTHFQSETIRRPDGHWVFIATEDGNRYELVHPARWVPFTELQLHDMRLDAMSKFQGYEVRVHVDPPRECCRKFPCEEPPCPPTTP